MLQDGLAAVRKAQRACVEHDPRLSRGAIPVTKLHVTLGTLRLDNEGQRAAAEMVLRNCGDILARFCPTGLRRSDSVNQCNE